ncbi:STE3-domain-containing protein [Rickenella mellea]|uniref:STE3-domain-containing protein n=1 Tax=Rickenella mellea TaxID=50990 RepID=A0A4Y7PYG2_9AGAM|nr:STE3-domain-containing protein [Rickenella mellea]
MDPTYPVYPVVSFLCFLLLLSPLPWQFRAWNTGTCMYIFWIATDCLICFINSLVWHNNAIDWAPVYCDISTRIMMGASVAIPACSLCIQRRLYYMTNTCGVTTSRREKTKNVCIDLAICLGFPLFIMALAYIPQGQRYDIFEDIGCLYSVYDVWPAILTFYIWPLVLGLISTVYCVMTLRSFVRRRSELNEFLNSGDNSIASNRYYRLMLLTCTEVVFTIPLASYVLYNVAIDMDKNFSWEHIHYGFHVVPTYPSIIWRNNKRLHVGMEFSRWIIILCAIVFCAFFTFAEDSRNNYRALFRTVAKRFGLMSIATHLNGTSARAKDGVRRNMSLPPMFPSRNKTRDSLIISSVTLDGLHMASISDDEKSAARDGSFASSSSSFVSGSHKDLPAIPSPEATSTTSPPAASVSTPGNDNNV